MVEDTSYNYGVVVGEEAARLVREQLTKTGIVSVYHTLECLYTKSGFKLITFEDRSGNIVLAVPLRFTKIWGFLNTAISHYPTIPFIGPIYTYNYLEYNVDKKYKLLQEVTRILLKRFKLHLTFLTIHPECIDIRPFIWNKWHYRVTYTYILSNLQKFQNIEEAIKTLRKRRRREYKEALKKNIEFAQVSLKDIKDQAVKIYKSMFTAKGFKEEDANRIINAFLNLYQDIDKVSATYIARKDDEILGFETFVIDKYNGFAIRHFVAYRRQSGIRGISTFLLVKSLNALQTKAKEEVKKILLLAAPVRQLAEFMEDFADTIQPYFTVYCGRGVLNKLIKVKTPPFHTL